VITGVLFTKHEAYVHVHVLRFYIDTHIHNIHEVREESIIGNLMPKQQEEGWQLASYMGSLVRKVAQRQSLLFLKKYQ
jgi:hypothetical protein